MSNINNDQVDYSKSLLRTERKNPILIKDEDIENLGISQLQDFAKSKMKNYDIEDGYNFLSKLRASGKNNDEVIKSFRNYIKDYAKDYNLTLNQKEQLKNLNNSSNYLEEYVKKL